MYVSARNICNYHQCNSSIYTFIIVIQYEKEMEWNEMDNWIWWMKLNRKFNMGLQWNEIKRNSPNAMEWNGMKIDRYIISWRDYQFPFWKITYQNIPEMKNIHICKLRVFCMQKIEIHFCQHFQPIYFFTFLFSIAHIKMKSLIDEMIISHYQ